jgi:broad specificity phosphatase PhoE
VSSDLAGVLLARHGETRDNLPPGRFQGWTDTPLNDTGRRQAVELAGRLATRADPDSGERPIASLWCSDLSRAHETASIVGAAIGLRPIQDWRLREGYRGRWEGFLFDEIRESEPEHFAAWLRGGASFRFPEGESLLEHQQRVTASLHDIHARGPLPALAVCHGGSIRVMLAERDRRGLDAFHDFEVPNVAVETL